MKRLLFAIIVGVLLLTFAPAIYGQSLPPGSAGTPISGWLHLIVGDPPRDSGEEGQQFTVLQNDDGTTIAQILMDENRARELSGQRVLIAGNLGAPQGGLSVAPLVIDAQSVQPLPPAPDELSSPAALVSGSQPWVNIICRFPSTAGIAHPASWYAPLFGDTYPGLDHYWQQLSYGNIDLTGTITLPKTYVLPHSRSYYLDPQLDLNQIALDCTAAANPDVYFPNFVGINLMLNDDLDCCAYGGGTTLTRDGQTRSYRITWLPPWGQDHSTIAHEMGHGFGFPHSSGPSWDPPSGLNIYVSAWDVMSASGGTCFDYNVDFGCIAPGTIAYHLDMDGWIPSSQRQTVIIGEDKTITLEQIRLPQSSSNKLLAKVLIGNSALHFYSVEARRFDGYDQSVPGQAVLIHDVYTQRTGNGGHALVVDDDTNHDVNDAGAMWLPGETFVDSVNNISIQVLSAGATSFTVRIINNSTQSPNPDPPTNWRTSSGIDSITLEWDDNSYNELGFKIYRWGNGGFSEWATVGPNVTSYTDNGVGCGNANYYQVTAYNNTLETDHDEFTWVLGMANPCIPALNTPSDAANLSASQVTLRWYEPWGGDHYEVALGTTSSPPTIATNITGSSYVASGLAGGTYFWRVRAVNQFGGASDWSVERTFTISSPVNAAPERDFFGAATLTWNPISWATGYHVQVARDANFNDIVYEDAALPDSTLSVSPTLGDGVYYWHVRAYEGNTPRAWSAAQRFTVG